MREIASSIYTQFPCRYQSTPRFISHYRKKYYLNADRPQTKETHKTMKSHEEEGGGGGEEESRKMKCVKIPRKKLIFFYLDLYFFLTRNKKLV
jgi:hypothetical protein